MVQQHLPSPVFRRLAKANDVIVETVPSDEQDVAILTLEAALKLEAPEARHSDDDAPGLRKGGLKLAFQAYPNIKKGNLENHGTSVVPPASIHP